jgi:O-antigen/teichoic acid export membrane protein
MEKKSSYKQILKATGILGGVQVVDILIRIMQMKIVAILLGPTGVGIIGLYKSTIDLIRSASGFGLDFSSVREIARADGTGDSVQISRTIVILRRWVWLTGIVGMLLTISFSRYLSRYAFGDEQYSWGISILSIVLLITAISGGQLALLQGLRKITLMAKAKVWGLVIGFFVTVPLYWVLGLDAIIPVIIITAIIILFYSWFYSRQIRIKPVQLGVRETITGGFGMVSLGFFMVVSSLITMASMYIVRAFIANNLGMEGVGQFQAGWTISSLYLTAVLQAMGTDYFPRLSAVSDDNNKIVALVNEQTEVALLISGPIVVGMISFISLVVFVLYSTKFSEAILMLHWMMVGTFLKVISWPMGFIILAKGRGAISVLLEIGGNAILLVTIYILWGVYKIEAAGMAYISMYVIYTIIVYITGMILCGFSWTNKSIKLIIIFGALILLAFLNVRYNGGVILYTIGLGLFVTAAGYSLYGLNAIIGLESIYKKILNKN